MINNKIHFIGIGGISLSGLARFCKHLNFEVSGSDLNCSNLTKQLKREGIKIYKKHNPKNVKDANIVVYTDAISKTNKELEMAKKLNKKIYSRAEFLSFVSNFFKTTVAVCGCHGKTTTTGLLHFALKEFCPTSHIGGLIDGNNFFIGKSDLFITEACEYKRNFLHLKPNIAVVLNIDLDHTDCYKNLQDVKNAFQCFANSILEGGTLIINGDDKNSKKIKHSNKLTFGLNKSNDYYAKNIKEGTNFLTFDFFKKNKFVSNIKLNFGLKHNVYNALASLVVCDVLNAKNQFSNIQEFSGIERRNQLVKTFNGSKIFHDYAHHPKEIEKIICEHKRFCKGKLFIAFESHTFSRTQALLGSFKTCFKNADRVFILPIYPAREKPIKGVSGKALATEIGCSYARNYRSCKNKIKKEIMPGDEILILGAGNIFKLANIF